jgi:hypothetical protein
MALIQTINLELDLDLGPFVKPERAETWILTGPDDDAYAEAPSLLWSNPDSLSG